MKVIFNKPYFCDDELVNLKTCLQSTGTSSDGKFSKACENWFLHHIHKHTILTVSCTAALEMAALLANIKPGDEVIMPSFTFASSANAFVLRGATPVFIDINPLTQNIDENLIEMAISPKTKAILVVHYAGVACNMDKILHIANKHNIPIIEDAAHAFGAKFNNSPLGSIGKFGCLSFHETKNISSGEGGAIFINNSSDSVCANLICEKGTNRQAFIVGDTDKYTWITIGSSFKMSDINAAVLLPQLLDSHNILLKRLNIWNSYFDFFKPFQDKGFLNCPFIPDYAHHNAHIFYLLFPDIHKRNLFISFMHQHDIDVKFHYIPLHSSPAGLNFGKTPFPMTNTNHTADTLVRLPLYSDLPPHHLEYIFSVSHKFFKERF